MNDETRVQRVLARITALADHLELAFTNAATAEPAEPGRELKLPDPPIQCGWAVTYRDADGRLAGGADDRLRGTVSACRWNGHGWTVQVLNGDSIPLDRIVAVGKVNYRGEIVSAWQVRQHGYDGERGAS